VGRLSRRGGRRQSIGLLRSISTQSEFWRQVAKAAPERLVSRCSYGANFVSLRMSLHEDGICGGAREECRFAKRELQAMELEGNLADKFPKS